MTTLSILSVILVVFALVVGGCSGKGSGDVVGVPPTGGGVTLNAKAQNLVAFHNPVLAAIVRKVMATAETPNDGHPSSIHRLITPTVYRAALKSGRLQNAESNPTLTYDIFDNSVTDPEVIDLTSNSQSVPIASNSSRPTVGTYTHMRSEIVYLEMEFRAADSNVGRVRWYMSSTGANNGSNPQQGDILVRDNADGVFKWINSGTGAYATARPAAPVDLSPFPPGATAVDPFNDVLQLGSSFTVNATSGTTTATMLFDVSNTFFFEDYNGNGRFVPGEVGGLGVEGTDGSWWPGPPVITIQQ